MNLQANKKTQEQRIMNFMNRYSRAVYSQLPAWQYVGPGYFQYSVCLSLFYQIERGYAIFISGFVRFSAVFI